MKTFDSLLLEELYQIITPSKVELFERIAPLRTRHITTILENIYQEHNASAVLRSCESFGVQDLHIIEKDNQYKVQRDIARGAGRWVDMHHYNEGSNPTIECLQTLKQQGFRIVATTPHTRGYSINTLPLEQPVALVFGTEKRGISQDVIDLADDFATIPMYGFTESFNISVSAAVCMHTLRTRLESSSFNWRLSEQDQLELKLKWCERIIPRGHLVVPEIRKRLAEKIKKD